MLEGKAAHLSSGGARSPCSEGRGRVSLLQTRVWGVGTCLWLTFLQSLVLHRPLGPRLSTHLPGLDAPLPGVVPWTAVPSGGGMLELRAQTNGGPANPANPLHPRTPEGGWERR